MRVAAIILAAGASTRMGRPKALMTSGTATLLQTSAEPFTMVGSSLVVVTGFHAAQVEPEAHALEALVVRNPAPWRGMASSVRTGIRRLDPGCDLVFVHPVDCPGVRPDTLRMLLCTLAAFPHAHAATPMYRGRGGHPVVLDRTAQSLMLRSKQRRTLRDLLAFLGPAAVRVETADPSVVRDLDTPEDAEAWLGEP